MQQGDTESFEFPMKEQTEDLGGGADTFQHEVGQEAFEGMQRIMPKHETNRNQRADQIISDPPRMD